eukprot:m.74060 g.74060  ORF g.74060 m.74060 type:complete len:433 (-) comp14352_c1_seq3:165-1463(-)
MGADSRGVAMPSSSHRVPLRAICLVLAALALFYHTTTRSTRHTGTPKIADESLFENRFTPFMAQSGVFDDASSLDLNHDRCQELAIALSQFDGYYYNATSYQCWLVKSPQHPSSLYKAVKSSQQFKPAYCQYVQLKPERVMLSLLNGLSSTTTSETKYNLLNSAAAVKAATNRCKSDTGSVVVLILDSGVEDFLRIWLHYWYEVTHTFANVIIIAQDVDLYETMDKLLPGQVLLEPAALYETDLNAQPAAFRSKAFGQRVKRRFYQLALIAATGVNVLYSDADAILFCNLLELLRNSSKVRAPIDNNPSNFNSGLIYVPSTPSALQLLMLSDVLLATDPGYNSNDQTYFNKGIAEAGKAWFQPLPLSIYPKAPQIWKRMEDEGMAQALNGKCYLHNNFIIGKEAKLRRFVKFGMDKNAVTDRHPGFQELIRP